MNYMGYVYLSVAAVLFTAQFFFSKKQQLRYGDSVCASGYFLLFQSLWGLFVWLIVNQISNGTLLNSACVPYAVLYSSFVALTTVSSIGGMRRNSVAMVTLYMLVGGQALPFLYSLMFTGALKTTGLLAYFGFIVINFSCVLTVIAPKKKKETVPKKSEKMGLTAFLYCLGSFLGNGMVSIATDMNGKTMKENATTPFDFLVANALVGAVLGIFMILINHKQLKPSLAGDSTSLAPQKRFSMKKSVLITCLIGGGYTAINGLGNVFSLKSTAVMQGSVQFPIMNSLILVLSPVLARIFFGEKIKKSTFFVDAFAISGILMIMLDGFFPLMPWN